MMVIKYLGDCTRVVLTNRGPRHARWQWSVAYRRDNMAVWTEYHDGKSMTLRGAVGRAYDQLIIRKLIVTEQYRTLVEVFCASIHSEIKDTLNLNKRKKQ